MARKAQAVWDGEHVIYCSGPDWIGDGSKATSPCPFAASQMTSTAARFKCSDCTQRRTPALQKAETDIVEETLPEEAALKEVTLEEVSSEAEMVDPKKKRFRKRRR